MYIARKMDTEPDEDIIDRLTGMFAQDPMGICEPVEGFGERPQDLKGCIQELIDGYTDLLIENKNLKEYADFIIKAGLAQTKDMHTMEIEIERLKAFNVTIIKEYTLLEDKILSGDEAAFKALSSSIVMGRKQDMITDYLNKGLKAPEPMEDEG